MNRIAVRCCSNFNNKLFLTGKTNQTLPLLCGDGTLLSSLAVKSPFLDSSSTHSRLFRTSSELSADSEFRLPVDALKIDFKKISKGDFTGEKVEVPHGVDIAVIGGGAIGLSTAFFIKSRHPTGLNVAVIEKDPTYSQAATVLSVGGLRQQFSIPENIKLSLFTAEFLRNIKEHLSVMDLDPPDVHFNPEGYLFLATEQGKETIQENHKIQISTGAKVDLMDQKRLKAKYPWLNVEDLSMGSYGLENEGWFDPWLLLAALKAKCINLGVTFIKGEVVDFETEDQGIAEEAVAGSAILRKHELQNIVMKTDSGKKHKMRFAACVNCAGPWSGHVAKLAGIGLGEGPLSTPLPVEPRKRYVYMIHCPDGPGLETPMLIDPTGVYVRREGLAGHYICGASPPTEEEEPDHSDLCVDHQFFDDYIWPVLAHRAPCFEKIKVKNAWAGYYDYNYFDQNLIIGNHPYHRKFFFATGCSGHGIQQALAIGRGVSEWLLDDEYTTIDLSRFSFDRVMNEEPLYEHGIV